MNNTINLWRIPSLNPLAHYAHARQKQAVDFKVGLALLLLTIAVALYGITFTMASPLQAVRVLTPAFEAILGVSVLLALGTAHLLFVRPELVPVLEKPGSKNPLSRISWSL